MKLKIAIMLLANALLGAIGGLMFHHFLPQYYFEWYWAIPVYYTIMGIVYAWVMFGSAKSQEHKLINVFMMMRGIKLMATIAGIAVYLSLKGPNELVFCLVMMVFYFLYMFMETYLYYNLEKERLRHAKR